MKAAHWINQKNAADKHSLFINSTIFISPLMTDTLKGSRLEFSRENFQLKTSNIEDKFVKMN